MGNNRLRSSRVMAYSPNQNIERVPVAGSAVANPGSGVRCKKAVRFEVGEDEINGGSGGGDGGVVRIKVVMTRKELKRILKDGENESCGLEKLIGELMVKGRTSIVEDVEDENGSWSPALESIPEHLD